MKLRDLIKQGELAKALRILADAAKGKDADFIKDITLIQAQFSDFERKKDLRTEFPNTLSVFYNRLLERIYDTVDEFEHQYGEIEIEKETTSIPVEKQNGEIYRTDKNVASTDIPIENNDWFTRYYALINLLSFIFIFLCLIFLAKKCYETDFSKLPFREIIVSRLPPIKTKTQIGKDKSDREATIEIDILDSQFTWKKNETITGEYTYSGKIIDLREYFDDQRYGKKVNEAKDLICIGNASFEENESIPLENRRSAEEDRALIRARHLKHIIRSLIYPGSQVAVYTLNLGWCTEKLKKTEPSNYQRAIVIIRVIKKEEDVNLKEALLDALSKEVEMPFKVKNYTLVQDNELDLDIK